MSLSVLSTLLAALLLVVAPGAHDSMFRGSSLGPEGHIAVCGLVSCGLLTGFWPTRRRVGAWVPALLCTLGHGGRGIAPADASPSSSLSVLTPLFALSLWLRRIPPMLAIVLVTFAVSHVMGMVLAAPWTFGLKTIQPIHGAFLAGAAFLLQPSADGPAPTWR
jgi:hypothetical protein